jgi:hypothetical protein
MQKILTKIAYRILLKYSYKYLPYFYCGNVYKVENVESNYDVESRKTTLTIEAERKWN